MKKTDIMQENLCIKRIISVIKGRNPQHHKLLSINGRHSDAFIYVLSGSCTYHVNGQEEFTATAGDVFYLPYMSTYTMYIHDNNYRFIFCNFDFAEPEEKHSAYCSNQIQKNADILFTRLLNCYNSSPVNAYTECMSILYSIYSLLQQETRRIYIGKSKEENIAEAKRQIDESFGNSELSISMLAEQIGVSEVYLRKLFNAQYGMSPSRYLISVRLRNAQKLMKYPFLTLEECATQSGFSSLQYFCRVFKNEIGVSPGQYRKKL